MRPALAALRGSRPSLSAAARTAAAQAGLGRAAAPPTRPCPSRKTPRSHRFLSTSTTPTSVTKGGTSPTSSLATPWLPTRTHYAGDLRSSHEGEEVILAGWVVQSRKPSAVLSFHPLRDSTGQVQLVMDAPNGEDKTLMSLPRESVIHVKGIVRRRPAEGVRLLDDPTGAVEVLIKEWHLLNPASSSLPFHPSDEYKMPNDDFRSKHRHLDLRRPVMTENIRLRSRVAHRMRCHLHDEGELASGRESGQTLQDSASDLTHLLSTAQVSPKLKHHSYCVQPPRVLANSWFRLEYPLVPHPHSMHCHNLHNSRNSS